MASIPLPALDIRPPQQQEDPVEKLMKLRYMAQQQQMMQQHAALIPGQLQLQQGQVQMQQQQLKDSQAITNALKNWDGQDYGKLAKSVVDNGGSGQAFLSVQQHALGIQKTVSEIAASDATTGSKNLETFIGKHTAIGDALQGIENVPPDQLHQKAADTINNLVQGKVLDPNMGQQLLQKIQATPDPNELRNQIDIFAKSSLGAKAVAERTKAAADAKKAQLEATALESVGGMTPQMQETATTNAIAKALQGQPLTATEKALVQAHQLKETKQTSSTNSMTGATTTSVSRPAPIPGIAQPNVGGGGGAGVPSGKQNLVDEIGTGKMAMERIDYLLSRNPELAQAVAVKYPDFDSSKVRSYIAAYKDFTSGKTADQITGGGAAMGHLARLKQINDENPVDVRIPGTKAHNAYQNLLDTVADELGKFYGEPKTNEVIQSKKASLGALFNRDAAIVEQAKAMGVRWDELENRWQNAAPSSAYHTPMPGVSSAAQKARASLDPNYQPKGAQAQTLSQTSGKVLSMAAVQKAAQEHGVSVDEAKRQAEAQGYQVK